MVTTVPVTCRASDQSGNPVSGARFQFRLSATEIDQGFIVPELVEATAGIDGVCVVNLWPNALGVAGSSYQVRSWNPDTGRRFLAAAVVVPNSACLLDEILVVEPYPPLDASAQALAAAQAALSLVTAQRMLASDAATSAGASSASSAASASMATTQAAIATSQANTASASAAAAAGSATTASTQASSATTQATNAAASAAAASGSATVAGTQAVNSASSASAAATSAAAAAASADVYTTVQSAVTALAANLISTQTIVVQHHAFQ